ncbi:hypothetical protein T01_4563 [Trichinella spiralis]|uniref:Uncharacterized protein n=1 Tax=Trichinella spiralis TaxID=6334 RepID=A0A0V1BAQ3_TRISP|nr:hypothetical protein T01_4563 [Trichinella spiralis]
MQIIAQNNNCCYVVLPNMMKYLDRNQSSILQRIKIIISHLTAAGRKRSICSTCGDFVDIAQCFVDYVDALCNYNIKFGVEVEGSKDGPLNVTPFLFQLCYNPILSLPSSYISTSTQSEAVVCLLRISQQVPNQKPSNFKRNYPALVE